MHAPAEGLGPELPVDEPLVEPGGPQPHDAGPGHEVEDGGTPEGDEARFAQRSGVGARVERGGAEAERDERRVQVGLVAEVPVHVLAEIPPAGDEAGAAPQGHVRARELAALDGEPALDVGHEIRAANGRLRGLPVGAIAVGDGEEQELREEGAREVARRLAAEERVRRDVAVPTPGAGEVAEAREIPGGALDEPAVVVPIEGHVAGEGHPVDLTRLGGLTRAREGVDGRHVDLVRVGASERERVGRARVGERGRAPGRDGVEVGLLVGLEGEQEGVVGRGIHLAQVVVGQGLGEAREPARVELLVAVAREVGHRGLGLSLGRIDAALEGLGLAFRSRQRADLGGGSGARHTQSGDHREPRRGAGPHQEAPP